MTAIQERPVAWAVNHAHGTTVWDSETKARKVADEWLASGVWVWAEVVPLYRQPRWISVSERLPDRYIRVLAFVKCEPHEHPHAIGFVGSMGLWSLDELHEPSAEITHWMPLPEPPA